jgi:hypothetical protein
MIQPYDASMAELPQAYIEGTTRGTKLERAADAKVIVATSFSMRVVWIIPSASGLARRNISTLWERGHSRAVDDHLRPLG